MVFVVKWEKMKKKDYIKIATTKKEMSQIFEENGRVIPYTNLNVNKQNSAELTSIKGGKKIVIVGKSKGKGFAGTVKRWGFRAGPRTHGQDKHRSPGSIGTQGQGRVIPGRKMAGRMGGKRVTLKTKILDFNKDTNSIMVKGAVPGHKNAQVTVYIEATQK